MKKRVFGFLMVLVVSIAMCMPVMADTTVEEITGNTSATTPQESSGTHIHATLASNYKVILPVDIELQPKTGSSANEFEATYSVKVTGQIADGQVVSVSPKADTFDMTDSTPGSSNPVVPVTISLNGKRFSEGPARWSYNGNVSGTAKMGDSVNGLATATIAHEGTYTGTVIFTYSYTR